MRSECTAATPPTVTAAAAATPIAILRASASPPAVAVPAVPAAAAVPADAVMPAEPAAPPTEPAAPPAEAERIFNRLVAICREKHAGGVETGQFGTHMVVSLVNDGPVTFLLRP